MKLPVLIRDFACIGVTIVAVAQAARAAAPPDLPPLALGGILFATLATGGEPARRLLTSLGFVFCAVAAARYAVRVPIPLGAGTVCQAAPAVLLLVLAVALQSASAAPSTLTLAAGACALAGLLGYLCLSRLYSLEDSVLRALVLNCALAIAGCFAATAPSPRKSLSYAVCAGLLLAGAAPALRMLLS